MAPANRDAFKAKRKNIRPDLVAKVLKKDTDLLPVQNIYDVKNVFSVKVNYICRDRLYAVKKCENKTKADYRAHAIALDMEFNITAQGTRGPIEERIDALGGIKPLVFGRFSMVNQNVIDLIDACSLMKARSVASLTRREDPLASQKVSVKYWHARFKEI